MLVTPAFAAMTQRKKDVSDMTRREFKPHHVKEHTVYAKGIFNIGT